MRCKMRGLMVVAVLLVISVGVRPQTVVGEDAVAIRFAPAFVQARPGEAVRLEIWIDGVTDLERLSFAASYNPTILMPLDADPGRDGVQLEAGSIFPDGYMPENDVIGGVIRFDGTRAPDAGPFSGSGMVAVAVFRVRPDAAPGSYPVRFSAASIEATDVLGHLIPVPAVVDATVRVPPVTTAIRGWITREGRSEHSRSGVSVLFYASESLPPFNWAHGCTDARGDFLLTVPQEEGVIPASAALPAEGPPSDSYEWAFVRLSYPNYNSECYWEPLDEEVVDIGWHTLEGGDINGDGCINIYDVVRIIRDFGESVPTPCVVPYESCPDLGPSGSVAPASDINGDCRVNIFDLSITGENFGLCTNCQ